MFKTLVLLGVTTCAGWAGTVTFTLSATASGILGGTPFSNSLMTITVLADTSTPSDPFSSTIAVGALSASFNTESPTVFFNPSCGDFAGNPPCAGFEINAGDLLDIPSASLAGYVLGTPIGPINAASLTGNPALLGTVYDTDGGGSMTLSALSNGTFTASVGGSSVPEPAALALVGCGLSVLGLLQRRKQR